MTRRDSRATLLIALAVFVPALLIRLHPLVRESFQYDAITSQMAAQRGVIANAFDAEGILELRRWHPPLLSYVILANNALFGDGDFAACVFSIVSGALTCVVVALGVAWALGAPPSRGAPREIAGGGWIEARMSRAIVLVALFAGWLLAFLPVHLFVSRSSNWDALYALLSTTTLLAIGRYVESGRAATLYLAGVLAALATATAELGLFLAPAFALALWHDVRRRDWMRRWVMLAAITTATLLVVWPAGILKLNLVRTILTRTRDSVLAARDFPWYKVYVELFAQSPAFTIVAALGFFGFVALAIASRRDALAQLRESAERTLARRLAPLWIYAAVGIVLSLRQSWVHVHLKDDIFPPLAMLGACVLAWAGGARTESATPSEIEVRPASAARPAGIAPRSAIAILAGVIALGSTIFAACTDDTMVVGPEEHPGYRGTAEFLAQHPGARTYAYYAIVMPYFLPEGALVEGDSQRAWTPAQIASVKARGYDFIVTDFTFFNERYPDIAALGAAFAPEYALAHTVEHRRTRAPVAWIFGHARTPVGEP
jgi:hypothetical protein